MQEITVQELHELDGVTLIDVREPYEFEGGRVAGAVNVPLQSVPEGADSLDPDQPVYLICQHGMRSERAAAYLESRGFDTVNVSGGTSAWTDAGFPLDR
jgi:rhodanese-related sulfurtransferase